MGSNRNGKTPNRLLTNTKENRAISSGKYLRKSCPIMSRAMVLRTKKYAVSPMYWPLLGTMAFLRAMINQNAKLKITERIAWSMSVSNQGALSKIGGKSKLCTPGASKPPVSSGTRPDKKPLTVSPTSPCVCSQLPRLDRGSWRPLEMPLHRYGQSAG